MQLSLVVVALASLQAATAVPLQRAIVSSSSSPSTEADPPSTRRRLFQGVTFNSTGTTTPKAANRVTGCAIVKSTTSQVNSCVKQVFTNGFVVKNTELQGNVVTFCSVAGSTGDCGVANPVTANVDLSQGAGTAPAPSGSQGAANVSQAITTGNGETNSFKVNSPSSESSFTFARYCLTPSFDRAANKAITVSAAGGAAKSVNPVTGCAIVQSTSSPVNTCVKQVFSNGFLAKNTDLKGNVVTLCSVAGNNGTCGAANPTQANVDLSLGSGTAPPPSGAAGNSSLAALIQ